MRASNSILNFWKRLRNGEISAEINVFRFFRGKNGADLIEKCPKDILKIKFPKEKITNKSWSPTNFFKILPWRKKQVFNKYFSLLFFGKIMFSFFDWFDWTDLIEPIWLKKEFDWKNGADLIEKCPKDILKMKFPKEKIKNK